MKKIIALILALLCSLSLFACGGNGDNGETNGGTTGKYNVKGDNKTVVNFTVYGGALAGSWSDTVLEEFAKRHAETNFGGGSKKGVYVNVTSNFGVQLVGLQNSGQHILTATPDVTPTTLAAGGELYNLSDIVKDTSRTGGTIENALYDDIKPLLKGADNNYYALPYFEYYDGLNYNRKVFDENGLFFADASDMSATTYNCKFSTKTFKLTNESGVLAKGPDGIANTEDDGLPSSMEELLVLMCYIKERVTGYWPVAVAGSCQNYSDTLVNGLWVSLAGQEKMQNYYNSRGTMEVVKRDNEGNIIFTNDTLFPGCDVKKPETYTVTLDDTNGYLGSDMIERYYAMAIMEIMFDEEWFAPEAENPGISNYDAQFGLMTGSEISRYSNYAMLIEYSYMYNEVKNSGIFRGLNGIGKKESDYDVRYMCLPSSIYYEENKTEEPTSLGLTTHYYLVVNNTVKKEADVEAAVVELVKFLYSEEVLQMITSESGFALSLKYDLPQEKLNSMSTYSKHLWQLRKNDGSNVIYNVGTSDGHKANRAGLAINKIHTYKHDMRNNVYSMVKTNGAAGYFNMTSIAKGAWS